MFIQENDIIQKIFKDENPEINGKVTRQKGAIKIQVGGIDHKQGQNRKSRSKAQKQEFFNRRNCYKCVFVVRKGRKESKVQPNFLT